MIFAINYSKQAARLVAEGKIRIDRFKCPNWPDMILEARRQCQVAVHFDIKTYQDSLDDVSCADVLRVMEQTDTPFVNIHLQATSNDLPASTAEAWERADLALEHFRPVPLRRQHLGRPLRTKRP